MAKIKDKVENALGEGRILILGAQVLLGFQYRSVMEKGFESLPQHAQYLKLVGLMLMLLAVALLIVPSAYHRIVAEGEDTSDVHRFTSGAMGLALWPFAFGIGIDFFVATEKLHGMGAGIFAGVIALLVALFYWNGLELIRKREREPRVLEVKEMSKEEETDGGTKLTNKIKHVLTEARTVLPGAQTLLGFQLITVLSESFDKLPASSKEVHLASLACVALAVIFLMTPAAYHRIVEEGEETEHFHRFSSRMLLWALVPLALGLGGDTFVVMRKTTESATVGLVAASVVVLLFYGLWFGLPFYLRGQHRPQAAKSPSVQKA